jgi:uncharacterized membrane protein YbjE (DUF340 family)
MNPEQHKTYIEALAASLTINVLVPLLILLAIFICVWVLFSRAQSNPSFHIENVLRDEAGKESAARVIMFGCFAVTSWALAVMVFALPNQVGDALLYYLLFWSGTDVAKELIQKWNGQMPFTKGPTQ